MPPGLPDLSKSLSAPSRRVARSFQPPTSPQWAQHRAHGYAGTPSPPPFKPIDVASSPIPSTTTTKRQRTNTLVESDISDTDTSFPSDNESSDAVESGQEDLVETRYRRIEVTDQVEIPGRDKSWAWSLGPQATICSGRGGSIPSRDDR